MSKEKTIYALGYFDGVHLGHAALLETCRKTGYPCGVVTFLGHPDTLLLGSPPNLINTPADRKRLLMEQGVRHVVELPFDEALMQTSWQDFLNHITEHYDAAGFVCGSDFRFGAKGLGSAEVLQEYCRAKGLLCKIVPQQQLHGVRISSTNIRRLLEQGNLQEAALFLGHLHRLSGTVTTGKQLGRTLGFPTANIPYPDGLVPLPLGVYAGYVTVDGCCYKAVANVGKRPTVSGEAVNVEAHLLNFSGDLYGKTVTVEFFSYLRPEEKFPSLCALQEQIQKDKNIVENDKLFEKFCDK